MKKILVVGTNSYIGDSFGEFISQWPDSYTTEYIDLQDSSWEQSSFAKYDVLFHVAGIAHIKETKENANLYYEVNRDLSYHVAQKAKMDGVKQFVFLSSGSVYGIDTGVITNNTPLAPKTHYGKSKAEAEELLITLEDATFSVVILRPLMVYGKNCKGNFQTVVKIVREFPVFPRIHNKRSLVYIDNLSSFVKLAIDQQLNGIYFPKNKEDVDTYEIATGVAEALGKKIIFSRFLGTIINILRNHFSVTRKAFGDLVYADTEAFNYSYCVVDTKQSIRNSI